MQQAQAMEMQMMQLKVQACMSILPILAKSDYDLAVANAARKTKDEAGFDDVGGKIEGDEPLEINPARAAEATEAYVNAMLMQLGLIRLATEDERSKVTVN